MIFLILAFAAWNVATRVNTTTKTTSSLSSVIDVWEKTCMGEERRDRQIKVRGEAEKALLDLFLGLAAKEPNPVSQEFVEQFSPLAQKIHVLPLPDCEATAGQLRSELPPG
jgi:hypothetical protein